MKAIILNKFGGTENFEVKEVEDPILQPGSVKIKIKSTAFNPIDYQMRKGSAESKLLKSTILGREISGIIVEAHPSVTSFKNGDEVYSYISNLGSNGSYAEFVVVPEVIIAQRPKNLSFNQSAAIPLVGLTAMQTLEKCNVANNDHVFITGGAGGVGSMIIRLLLQKGVRRIYTTAGNEESVHKISNYGLPKSNIINYKSEVVIEELSTLTNGIKIDICIDTVGIEMSDLCAQILKINGLYADIAFATTDTARELLFDKGITIINVSNYAYGLENDVEKMKHYGEGLSKLKTYFENDSLPATNINVIGDFSVDTVAKAHHLLETNGTKGSKLVMEIN